MWDLSQRSNKGIIKYSVGGFICHICIYNCPRILPVKVILSFKKSKGKNDSLKHLVCGKWIDSEVLVKFNCNLDTIYNGGQRRDWVLKYVTNSLLIKLGLGEPE